MARIRVSNITVPDNRFRWRNDGGGRLRLRDGRKIMPGEVFLAYPHEVSDGFRDVIKCLDKEVPKLVEPPENLVKAAYTIKHRGGGLYNILDHGGKIVNESSMKKDEALEYIKALEG